MKRSILILPVLLIALAATGCGEGPQTIKDAEKYGHDCKQTGEESFECLTENARGKACTIKLDEYGDTKRDCGDGKPPKLNCNEDTNTSGNVCVVTLKDGTECVAVLPDGESNRKQDNIECPTKPPTAKAPVAK